MRKYTKASSRVRIIILIFIVIIAFSLTGMRLLQFQIVEGAEHLKEAQSKQTSSITVEASRGDIVDRYDRPLATSKVVFNVVFDWAFTEKDTINQTIFYLIGIFEQAGVEWIQDVPIEKSGDSFEFIEGRENDVDALKKVIRLGNAASAQNCVDKMIKHYGINDYGIQSTDGTYQFEKDRNKDIAKLKTALGLDSNATAAQCMEAIEANPEKFPIYNTDDAFKIAAVRYNMDKKEFSINNRYIFAEDIKNDLVIKVKEQSFRLGGVDIVEQPVRTYVNGDVASHILGNVGPIYKEEYDNFKSLGYQMGDTVGKSGVEKAFEEYLKGTNGIVKSTQNEKGDIVSTQIDKQAESGNTIRLSIDSVFQKKLQDMLANYVSTAQSDGHKSTGGAIVVLDVKTGEVLAAVSYPTYSLEDYKKNYAELQADTARSPLTNKAFNGLYRPGSSFKPVVATAGLMTGVIDGGTKYPCENGRFIYADSTYGCVQEGHHGRTNLNVEDALHWSCNSYFYRLGLSLGIDKLNEYSKAMGLGAPTGLEIPSQVGRLTSPETSAKFGSTWVVGNLIQASIGQQDTMISPVQMALEALTIANKGTRYEAHIVEAILDANGSVKKQTEPIVANQIEMTDSIYNSISNGMNKAANKIKAPNQLKDLGYRVAVKTGTPQTTDKDKTNNDFVAFAPIEDPEIAISCMVENDKGGSYNLIRGILQEYQNCKELAKNEKLPQYPQELADILS